MSDIDKLIEGVLSFSIHCDAGDCVSMEELHTLARSLKRHREALKVATIALQREANVFDDPIGFGLANFPAVALKQIDRILNPNASEKDWMTG
jgi:hypothetical protein